MSIVPITVVPVLELTIGSRTPVLKSVALPILPGGKASPIVTALTLPLVRRSLDERLWNVRSSARLGLKSWLLRLLVRVLPLGRRGETIRQAAKISVIFRVVVLLPGSPLLTALCERLRSLRGGNKPKVMLGVLQVILSSDGITTSVGVSGELEVFFRDVMGVAAYFDVWAVRFIRSRQRIGPSPIVRRPTAHPLVLTWSHFNFPNIRLASPELFRLFSAQAFSNLARGRQLTPSRHSNGLISSQPRRTDISDRIDPDPVRTFPSPAGDGAQTTVLTSGRSSRRLASPDTCFATLATLPAAKSFALFWGERPRLRNWRCLRILSA